MEYSPVSHSRSSNRACGFVFQKGERSQIVFDAEFSARLGVKDYCLKWKRSTLKIFYDTISIRKAKSVRSRFGLMQEWLILSVCYKLNHTARTLETRITQG